MTESTMPPVGRTIEGLVFSGEPTTVPVTIGVDEYYLKEASGEVHIAHQNRVLACSIYHPDGSRTYRDFAAVEAALVASCLFDKTTDRPVPITKVRSWNSKVYRMLYDKILEISGIDEGEGPERRLLHEALQEDTSPIGLQDLRQWINGLAEREGGKRYKPLVKFLSPLPDELAKN